MKALSIARKTLLELLREPLTLALLVAFPVVLIVLYGVAFGQTGEGLSSYLKVLVINEDTGATAMGEHREIGAQFVDLLREMEYEGSPVFDVSTVADRQAAEITLREHKAALLLVIPPDFTQALFDVAAGGDGAVPAILSLVGDPNADNFIFARSMLDGLVREFAREATGWQDDTLTLNYEFVPGTGTMSDFDFGVAGVIVFGLVLLVVSTAMLMVREHVSGTLRRLRLTRARARDQLVGVTLAQMVLAAVIVPVTFGAALLFGFESHGSLLLAMGVGLLFSLAAVGLGLIVACFSRSDSEAANLGAIVGVMMVLMSGAMYPMPDAPLITIAGRTIQIYDILPPAHAGEAMRRVLIYGEGPGAIAYELVALTLLSALFLAVGVLLYQRLQMRQT